MGDGLTLTDGYALVENTIGDDFDLEAACARTGKSSGTFTRPSRRWPLARMLLTLHYLEEEYRLPRSLSSPVWTSGTIKSHLFRSLTASAQCTRSPDRSCGMNHPDRFLGPPPANASGRRRSIAAAGGTPRPRSGGRRYPSARTLSRAGAHLATATARTLPADFAQRVAARVATLPAMPAALPAAASSPFLPIVLTSILVLARWSGARAP